MTVADGLVREGLGRAHWTLVGDVRLLPGFAYGFSYPSFVLNVVVPALGHDARARLWHAFFGLFEGVCDPPLLTEPNAASLPQETDHHATVRWFACVADRLSAMAHLPVVEGVRCIGIDGATAAFAVPGTARSRQPHAQLLVQAVQLFASLSDGQGNTGGRSACQTHLAAMRDAMPGLSNVPRMIAAAVRGGIAVQELVGTQAIQYGLGRKAVLFNSTFTQFTPTLGTHMARAKHEAAIVLRRNRLPVPAHHLARDEADAIRIAEAFGYPVVVKPADRDGGVGVRAGLQTQADLLDAYRLARQISPNVLVERHAAGRDYRLTVIRGQCVWAIERQPAGVVGDGRTTLAQLVAQANMNPARSESPHAPLTPLRLDEEALGLLRSDGLTAETMPDRGRFVRLRRSANVSSGGMPVAVADRVHPDNAALAVRAAGALQLDVAGVDLIMLDIAVSWKDSEGVICEVNAQPGFCGTTGAHLYPLLLQTMVQGDGHVPVIAILGGHMADLLADDVAAGLNAAGIKAGAHTRAGITVGGVRLEQGAVAQLAAGRMLSLDPAVEALVFAVNDGGVLRDGFPVPRVDVLALIGEPVAGFAGDTGLDLRRILSMLAPAARQVCLLDGAGAVGMNTEAVLEELGIPFRRATSPAFVVETVNFCRSS